RSRVLPAAGVAEERLARLPYHGLVADVGQVEGDLDDVGEIGATGPQAGAHVFEGLHGLPLRVADSDDLPVFIPGDHARYINEILDLEGQGGGAAEIGCPQVWRRRPGTPGFRAVCATRACPGSSWWPRPAAG